MTPSTIHPLRYYKGADGRTRKVLQMSSLSGTWRVRYRDETPAAKWTSLSSFALWAKEDVTGELEGKTNLVKK